MKSYPCTRALPARLIIVSVLLTLLCCGIAAAQGPLNNEVWITTGQDFFDRLVRTPGVLSQSLPPAAIEARGGVVITKVPARDLSSLSEFGHEKFNRCSGFIVHKSREEAVEAMMGATALQTKTLPSDFQINEQSMINTLLPSLDKTNILNTINHLSTNYVNRYYQYASGQNAALWIRDQWLAFAGSRTDVTVETFNHSFVQDSVIMTVQGTTLASEIIVIGGHLDSIRSGGMTTSTVAPGADDNASGIATITEVIRVLMANNFTPDRTVKFMGYAGEEQGLLGSADIASAAQSAGDDVVAVMQLDMTDFNGSVEDVSLIDDFTNADLRSFTGALLDEYQPELIWSTSTCGYACSDHASWHNRGFAAVMPFEARMHQHNSAIHTSNDTLATLGNQTDHALKFAKLALSFAVETGLADCTPAVVADAGQDQTVNEGNSALIGTPALANHTYSWAPGGATTAQINVSPASTSTYTVTATTSCGSNQDSVKVTVIPAGQNGPQNAVYDGGLGAPQCAVAGSSCDSQGLLDGRGPVGPEPNQPNTLDSCTDGSTGTYHNDESSDRIVVSTLDGLDFTEGATVQVDVTVYAFSTGSEDTLDLYYTADTNSPSWQLIGSYPAPDGGEQTISAQYNLPSGALQAVRANFRYQGSQSSCSGGIYDDADDLAFAVGGAAPACTVDADCDDGAWCNGAETCNAGTCQAGTAPACDDGAWCNGTETCNEGTDSCDAGTAPACDDGLYCNGTETCNETTDSCDAGTAPACDDGLYCNGTETCNEGTDSCDAGAPPVCTFGCDEAGDTCFECSVDADCNDGLFCTGVETCNSGSCSSPGDPCAGGETCNETTDTCDGQSCAPLGASCAQNSDCCTNKCRGKAGSMTCK